MFELTLCLDFERQKYISEFYKTKLSGIKKELGVIIKHNSEGKSYISFAVQDSKKEYLKSLVLDFVIKVIEKEFKYNFFKERLSLRENNSLTEAFLRAISCYDEEIDREVIAQVMDFSGEIVVESLFYFRLQPLQMRWVKTAEIINKNFVMNSDNSMSEVLRYLCGVSENNSVLVDLQVEKEQIVLKNFLTHKIFKKDASGISQMFAEIIMLNPSKINIRESQYLLEFEEITDTLLKVFNDKIYFV